MTDLDSVCTAAKNRLVAGGYTRSWEYVPDNIVGYALAVMPGDGQFLTFDTSYDSDDYELVVKVLVEKGTARTGQLALKEYIARSGVHAALMADPTLGGEVDDIEITGWSNYGLTTVALKEYYSADLTVIARASV